MILRSKDIEQAYAVRLMQHLVVPTFVLNPKREVVIWNRACERLTGVAAQDVIGTSEHWRAFYGTPRYCLADLLALGRPDELASHYPEHTVSEGGSGFSAENWCVMPQLGNQLYLAIDAGPIHDEDGELIAVVETLRDMTDHKRAEAALKSLAASDGLTGLANRRSFDQTLASEWLRSLRSGKPLSLILADIDHFKSYNDHHGHQRGDDCLRSVATVIGGCAHRPADLACRYGGEEFAIILPETDLRGARFVANRLRHNLAALKLAHGASSTDSDVTVSIGIATQVPVDANGFADVLKQADSALYSAKRSGRNRIVVSDESASFSKDRLGRAGPMLTVVR